ncbi:14387_t:CDS:1, partial [Racocetra fulgida]
KVKFYPNPKPDTTTKTGVIEGILANGNYSIKPDGETGTK